MQTTYDTAKKIADWRTNVSKFAYDLFGIVPDKWQQRVFDAFPSQDEKHLRISMQACVGPGKTLAMAVCGWNFMMCYGDRDDHPKGAAVAVTKDNLKDNLWPEYSKLMQRSELLRSQFEWTKERIFSKEFPETWFISARSFSRKADPEEQGRTLSGLHSRYWLVQVDESGEVPPAVGRAAEQAMSQENAVFRKIMQAGNPTSRTGMLYHAASMERHKWFIVRITGDPEDPDRSPRVDIKWAKGEIEKYGRDNPWVKSQILGEFPEGNINSLLTEAEVEAALGRHLKDDVYAFAEKRIGVDVALEGDDRTVLWKRQGLANFKPIVMRTKEPADISGRLAVEKSQWGSEMEFVDSTGGYGSGVVSHYNMSGNVATPVNFASRANDSEKYYNRRAEMWWRMAEHVKAGAAIPYLPEIVQELCAPTYSISRGKLLIEPKDKVKERIGRSPDLADAFALTFALPDKAGRTKAEDLLGRIRMFANQNNRKLKDYDPFDPERE